MTTTTTATSTTTMILGAIVGDMAGSTYERANCKSYQNVEIFRRRSCPTDDTVLTLATADYFLRQQEHDDDNNNDNDNNNDDNKEVTYAQVYHEWGNRYPRAGYGRAFYQWLKVPVTSRAQPPYNSWGNGAAMRVSPIAWIPGQTLEWVLEQAKASASVTHNHPEGIKGAQATAAAIYLARTTGRHDNNDYDDKEAIRQYISQTFGYNLQRTVAEIRPTYQFSSWAMTSVPEAIIAFLDSQNFDDCIRLAISLGGDSDTIAAIAGSIAQAYYNNGEIPPWMAEQSRSLLDATQGQVSDDFAQRFMIPALAESTTTTTTTTKMKQDV